MPEQRSPHLLVVVTNFRNSSGGVESHLQALLPRLVGRGVIVTVVQLGGGSDPYLWQGVRVLPLRRHLDVGEVVAVPSPLEWARVVRLVRSGRLLGGPPVTDVATHTRFFPMSALGVLLARDLSVPLLHTEHGGGFVAAGGLVSVASRLVDLTLGRFVLRAADDVLAVSARTAEFVGQLAGIGCVPFGNGLDLARWVPSAQEGPAERPRSLVYVGRLVEEKGWRTFLRVVEACREAGWQGEAHLAGDGPDLERAGREATRLGGTTVHGRLDPERIRRLLHGSVYVNPSTASEGFQLTQVEAAAAGATVVGYEVGVARELAAAVPTVVVVPSGDEPALTAEVLSAVDAAPTGSAADLLGDWDWDVLADRYATMLHGHPVT